MSLSQFEASVLVDTVAPSLPAIVIQGLANDVTNVASVVVSATATGALRRQLSLNSKWLLSAGAGFKTVYYQFRDLAGNMTYGSLIVELQY